MRCARCSTELKPVVAVDIDGTLAQWHRAFMDFLALWDMHVADRYDGSRVWNGVGEFSEWLGMDKKHYQEAKLAFRAGGFKRWMMRVDGAKAFMYELSRLPVEVWLTTTRPWMRLDNVDSDTREWLRRNAIPYDYLMFDEDKYGTLIERVDQSRILMVLDDEAVQRDRCAQLGLPFVLKQGAFNYGVEAEVWTDNFATAYNMIEERLVMYEALRQ